MLEFTSTTEAPTGTRRLPVMVAPVMHVVPGPTATVPTAEPCVWSHPTVVTTAGDVLLALLWSAGEATVAWLDSEAVAARLTWATMANDAGGPTPNDEVVEQDTF